MTGDAMAVEDRARELAAATGMKAVERHVFGRYQGHLVNVRFGGAMENYRVTTVVKVAPDAAEGTRSLVEDKDVTKPLRRYQTSLAFQPQANVLVFQLTPMGMTPEVEVLSTDLANLTGIAIRAGSKPGDMCESCGTNPGQPIVMNDEPMNLCPSCLHRMQGQYVHVKAATGALKPDYAKGLAFGFLGALIGGAIWGGIGAATGYIFGLVAFVNGIIVAWFLIKGAKVVTTPLIGVSVGFTFLSVFIGDIIAIAVITGADIATVLAVYPEFLAPGPGTVLLGYFFAVFGVIAAIRALRRTQREQTPRFEVLQ